MYTVWHVDKYKITFKLVINHWTRQIDISVDCNWVNTRWQWYSTHDQYIG